MTSFGSGPILLEAVAAEIESFVGETGWDGPPILFALVPTRILAADPSAAAVLGTDLAAEDIPENSLTPIAQEELPEGPLDEALAQIGWPDEVVGCALSQEILMLPPSAQLPTATDRDGDADEGGLTDLTPAVVAEHPDRREARLVVAVLRDGRSAAVLRLRAAAGSADDVLTGQDLAPNLVAALAATLAD